MILLGQICGCISAVCSLLYPLMKKKWQMMAMSLLANLFGGLNCVFLGSYSAAVISLVAVLQTGINCYHSLKNGSATVYEKVAFLLAFLFGWAFPICLSRGVGGMFSYVFTENLWEILPLAGAMLFMVSVFQKTEQKVRVVIFFNHIVWLVYYIHIGSTMLISIALGIATICIGYYREWRTNQKAKA